MFFSHHSEVSVTFGSWIAHLDGNGGFPATHYSPCRQFIFTTSRNIHIYTESFFGGRMKSQRIKQFPQLALQPSTCQALPAPSHLSAPGVARDRGPSARPHCSELVQGLRARPHLGGWCFNSLEMEQIWSHIKRRVAAAHLQSCCGIEEMLWHRATSKIVRSKNLSQQLLKCVGVEGSRARHHETYFTIFFTICWTCMNQRLPSTTKLRAWHRGWSLHKKDSVGRDARMHVAGAQHL